MVNNKSEDSAVKPQPNGTDGVAPSADQRAVDRHAVDPLDGERDPELAQRASASRDRESDPIAASPAATPVIDLPADAYSDANTSTPRTSERTRGLLSSTVLPALSGAVAAAVVVAAVWIAALPLLEGRPAPAADNSATIDALTARLASVESKSATPAAAATDPVIVTRLDALEKSVASLRDAAATPRPASTAPDPALAARIDGLEKSVVALRTDLATAASQSQQLAGAIAAQKSAPADAAPVASPELAALAERLNQVERAAKATPIDDAPLRRLVAATLLDLSVSHGEPYAAALQAARAGATDGAGLKALDMFAASGVPSAASLSRELIALLPQLSPAAGTSGSAPSLLDRLQAGAEGLVRIQRSDGVPGGDRAAIVSRIAAAAQRADIAVARRELNALSSADRAPAQPWIEKADARDAALAASRQLAATALAALPKTSP